MQEYLAPLLVVFVLVFFFLHHQHMQRMQTEIRAIDKQGMERSDYVGRTEAFCAYLGILTRAEVLEYAGTCESSKN